MIAEYLEEIYPEPSLLGATPRECAHIRTLARIGDIYLLNNTYMLAVQTRALAAQTPITTGNESIVAFLGGQLASNTKALDRMICRDGFACLGRVTLADCALVPALFFLENALPNTGLDDPIAANANVAAYWAAIQEKSMRRASWWRCTGGWRNAANRSAPARSRRSERRGTRQGKPRSRPSHGHRGMRGSR